MATTVGHRSTASAPEAGAERPGISMEMSNATGAVTETETGTRVGNGVNRLTESAASMIQLKSSGIAATRQIFSCFPATEAYATCANASYKPAKATPTEVD